jgi:hypothetical protein
MAFLARHSTLGVLLQLMLTGKISFDRKSLRDSEKHQLDTDLPLQEQPSPDQSSAEEGGSPRHHRLVRWDNEGSFVPTTLSPTTQANINLR